MDVVYFRIDPATQTYTTAFRNRLIVEYDFRNDVARFARDGEVRTHSLRDILLQAANGNVAAADENYRRLRAKVANPKSYLIVAADSIVSEAQSPGGGQAKGLAVSPVDGDPYQRSASSIDLSTPFGTLGVPGVNQPCFAFDCQPWRNPVASQYPQYNYNYWWAGKDRPTWPPHDCPDGDTECMKQEIERDLACKQMGRDVRDLAATSTLAVLSCAAVVGTAGLGALVAGGSCVINAVEAVNKFNDHGEDAEACGRHPQPSH